MTESTGRLLSTAERQRFVRYCRENAESCDAIAKVIAESSPQLAAVAKHNRTRAMAYAIVASDLEAVEDVTIQDVPRGAADDGAGTRPAARKQ